MKKFKSLAALMLALVMVLSLAACGGTKAPVDEGGQQQGGDAKLEEVMGITIPEFSVLVNGVAVTHEMMADYAVYKVVATSVNSSGTESTVTYCGFSMADVLTATGLKGEATKLTAVATDGYEVEYDAALLKEADTLLALTKDGEPFSKAPWFAPCSSETTGDYMKLLSELKIEGMDVKEGGEKQPAGEGEEIDLDALPEISDRTDKVVFADFCFKVNGKEVKNADLEGLSIYKIERSMLNKKGNIKTSTYTGY
ncbi:MAG: hypothetical protein IJP30_04190 [Clostridia bacterium]|nr:hypothetical protein [Clostridia bacterium]